MLSAGGGGRCSSNDSREKQKPTWAAHITVQSQNVMNESLNSLMGSSRSAVAAGQRSVSREKRGSRGRWGWGGGVAARWRLRMQTVSAVYTVLGLTGSAAVRQLLAGSHIVL